MTMPKRPQVVVVGAGFGGMAAVASLQHADVDVLLVDQKLYNTFQPLLYQVATGGLNPGDVTYTLRAFCSRFRNAHFRHAVVTGIDHHNKTVIVDDAEPIPYDYLVIGTGVAANFFGIPGVQEHAFTIYTRGASLLTRDQIFSRLEYLASPGSGSHDINLVVVGGGPTGVEMAGTLAEMTELAVPYAYPEIDTERIHVHLIEMGAEVLGPFDPKLKSYAAKTLERKGVELHLGVSVTEVTPTECRLSNGEVIKTRTVIWGAGVAPRAEVTSWGLPLGRGGRIEMGDDCRVTGFDDVFAIGDVAVNAETPLPQLAQPALQQGEHVAQQITKLMLGLPTTKFSYKDKGIMATIGRHAAIAQTPQGLRMKGYSAWWAWILLHVVVLLSKRNRFSVMTNLAARYLAYPKNVNLIVGDTKRPQDVDLQRRQVEEGDTLSAEEAATATAAGDIRLPNRH